MNERMEHKCELLSKDEDLEIYVGSEDKWLMAVESGILESPTNFVENIRFCPFCGVELETQKPGTIP